MTALRKAQLKVCKIGKFHGYMGIGYDKASDVTIKLGLNRISKHLRFKAWEHTATASAMCIAALNMYPNKGESA